MSSVHVQRASSLMQHTVKDRGKVKHIYKVGLRKLCSFQAFKCLS